MGQVPKNNIIKAQSGATLSLKVNGVLKQVPIEKADEMAALEADRLIEVGELRPSEKSAYMSSWNKLKNKTMQGEFSIDTAGKSTVSSVGYTGDVSSFGTMQNKEGETVAAEGSNLRNRFTKKIRKGNLAQMEATVARTMFPKIGQLSLEGDEVAEAKAKTDAEELKLKTDAEVATAKAAEEVKWSSTSPDVYLSKQFGGAKDYQGAFMNLPIEERESMLKGHAQDIVSNWLQYKPLQGQSMDWMQKHKDAEGNLKYGAEFYKDLYPRILGTRGLEFINATYNTVSPTEETPLTPEEKVEKEKVEGVRQRDKELEWKGYLTKPNIKRLDNNTIELPEDSAKVHVDDPNRKFINRFVYDPVKKIIKNQLIEYPSSVRSGSGLISMQQNKGIVYEKRVDPRDGKSFYVNTNNEKDIISPESLSKNIESKFPSPLIHKDGGVITMLQAGGWIPADASDELKELSTSKTKVPEKVPSKSNTSTSKSSTKKDTETKLSEMGDWSTSDILEATSLGSEIGSLVAAFTPAPGASFVSAGLGAAGTSAQMAAEKSRGELGWEDTGKYALAYALDAAAAVPGLGIAAKIGKIGKKTGTVANLISKGITTGLFLKGGVDSVKALNDIKNKLTDEKQGLRSLTTDDIRSLSQALSLIGSAAQFKAGREAYDGKKPFEGPSAIGKAVDKKTKIATSAELKRTDEGNWEFADESLRDTHDIGKKKSIRGKIQVIGAEDVPNIKPYPVKSSFKIEGGDVIEKNFIEKLDLFPLRGKEKLGWSQKLNPIPKTSGYIKNAEKKELDKQKKIEEFVRLKREQRPEATFKKGGKILKAQQGLNTNTFKQGTFGLKQPSYTTLGNNILSNIKVAPILTPIIAGVNKPSFKFDPTVNKFPTSKAKDPTILEKIGNIKLNEKQGLDLSEFGRTMYLNKVLGEKTNPLYIPTVTDKMETRTSIGGDLLTKQTQYNRASQLMNSSMNAKSSDPIRNFIQNLATNAQAEQIRNQADLEYSQGLERSKGIQAQLMDQAASERKQAADQRSMYFTKASAAKDEADWATKVGRASNLNTYWASKNLEKKQELAQKEGGMKAFQMQQKQADIDSRYPGIVQKYLQSGPNGGVNLTFKNQYDKYSKELAEATRQIYYQKDGGTARYKHEMTMYKEEYKSKKDIASAINRWTTHQSDRTFQNASKASKELNDLVSKIFTK